MCALCGVVWCGVEREGSGGRVVRRMGGRLRREGSVKVSIGSTPGRMIDKKNKTVHYYLSHHHYHHHHHIQAPPHPPLPSTKYRTTGIVKKNRYYAI